MFFELQLKRDGNTGCWALSQSSVVCVFTGDKLEDLEESNPFCFKEYLKTKNLSLSKEDTTTSRKAPTGTRAQLPCLPAPWDMAWNISSHFLKTQQEPAT